MSDYNWKENLVKERLGSKTDWTESERLELSQQLDKEIDDRFDKLISGKNVNAREDSQRVKDGWTEQNWKEKMAEHPIFAPMVQEGEAEVVAPDGALTDGLAQLKFDPDHNSPQELAQNYKDEGVQHFKFKRYRQAVIAFSEGIRSKCSDSELMAQLLNNRAAAYYRQCNFRSAIRDCEQAIVLKPGYRKAIQRAAESADRLGQWDEMMTWCDKGLFLDPGDAFFVELRTAAVQEKNASERITRKKQSVETRKLTLIRQLIAVIKKQGVQLEGRAIAPEDADAGVEDRSVTEVALAALPDLEPCHPSATGSKVHQNKCGDLVWPVLLLYPEYQQTDFIQHFNEKHSFLEQLEVVFGDGSPSPHWDRQRQYSLARLAIYYEDRAKQVLVPVTLSDTLKDTLADSRHVVQAGTPSFIIVVSGSKFLKNFLTQYN